METISDLEMVTVSVGIEYNGRDQHRWRRENGYRITLTTVGVFVERLESCKEPKATGEPDRLWIPMHLVKEPSPAVAPPGPVPAKKGQAA